jgi:biopolymer transport protein ExbD
MAGGSLYEDDDGGVITEINVTPLVDVMLVLVVIFMVTAKLIVGRGIEVDKPKAAAGGEVHSTLRIVVDKEGILFVNGDRYNDRVQAIARVREITKTMADPKALIAGDQAAAYGGVMRAIDVVQGAGITKIALENQPLPVDGAGLPAGAPSSGAP